MRVIGISGCLAGPPVAVLAVLAALQWVDFWPAAAGMVVVMLAAGAFALVWGRDLDLLTDAVRRIASDDLAAVNGVETPVMMDRLGREIERLSRRLASRAALQEQDPARRYAYPGTAAGSGYRSGA